MQVENDYREGVREGLSEGVTLQPRRGESEQPCREHGAAFKDRTWPGVLREQRGQRCWQGLAWCEVRFSPAGAGSVEP